MGPLAARVPTPTNAAVKSTIQGARGGGRRARRTAARRRGRADGVGSGGVGRCHEFSGGCAATRCRSGRRRRRRRRAGAAIRSGRTGQIAVRHGKGGIGAEVIRGRRWSLGGSLCSRRGSGRGIRRTGDVGRHRVDPGSLARAVTRAGRSPGLASTLVPGLGGGRPGAGIFL
jgi:hypothetical protein